jgi:hypothetical protein
MEIILHDTGKPTAKFLGQEGLGYEFEIHSLIDYTPDAIVPSICEHNFIYFFVRYDCINKPLLIYLGDSTGWKNEDGKRKMYKQIEHYDFISIRKPTHLLLRKYSDDEDRRMVYIRGDIANSKEFEWAEGFNPNNH